MQSQTTRAPKRSRRAGALVLAVTLGASSLVVTSGVAFADTVGANQVHAGQVNVPAAPDVDHKVTDVPTIEGEKALAPGKELKLGDGLYQSGVAADGTVFVSSSYGGRDAAPADKGSKLYKVNASSLEVEDEQEISVHEGEGEDETVADQGFGLGVDDANGYVWVANTNENKITAYKQSDLSKVGSVDVEGHNRDIAFYDGKAYVSGGSAVQVVDTKSMKVVDELELDGEDASALSLAVDTENGVLATVDMKSPNAYTWDLKNGAKRTKVDLGKADSPSGVDIDPVTGYLYVAAQGSGDLTVVDPKKNDIINVELTGEEITDDDGNGTGKSESGALNVAFDQKNRVAYVSNFGSTTVTMHSDQGSLVTTLDANKAPNHVEAGSKGNVFVTTRGGDREGTSDSMGLLQRFQAVAPQPSKAVAIPEDKKGVVTGIEAPVTQGLYQTAVSKESGAVFAAAAVGRPPVRLSQLVKLDPETLQVTASVSPEKVDGDNTASRLAVYSVDVDDANGNVWVTNTRQNTVAVYKQDDLSLVKQFPADSVDHARDVVIDEEADRAYVSANGTSNIEVFDTEKLEQLDPITLEGNGKDEDGEDAAFKPMSLALDAENHKLFTVTMGAPKAAQIDTETGEAKYFDLSRAEGASGVDYNPDNGYLYVVSQTTGNLLVVDTATGETVADVNTGDDVKEGAAAKAAAAPTANSDSQPLNVTVDRVSGLVYVANFAGGDVTVTDLDGEVQTTAALDGGKINDVSTDGDGNVYAVNKGGDRVGYPTDRVFKLSAVDDEDDGEDSDDADGDDAAEGGAGAGGAAEGSDAADGADDSADGGDAAENAADGADDSAEGSAEGGDAAAGDADGEEATQNGTGADGSNDSADDKADSADTDKAGSSDKLSNTGFTASMIGIIGGVIAAIGGLALWGSRRRRH